MPCAFKPCPSRTNSNSGLKWEHLESSFSATKTVYLHYHNTYGHQTCQSGDLPWVALIFKITWPFHHVVLRDRVTNWNHFNYTTRVVMATKISSMVTYLNGLLPIRSHDCFIAWSHKIMWQTKSIMSPLPQCLWQSNLAVCCRVTYLEGLQTIKS